MNHYQLSGFPAVCKFAACFNLPASNFQGTTNVSQEEVLEPEESFDDSRGTLYLRTTPLATSTQSNDGQHFQGEEDTELHGK